MFRNIKFDIMYRIGLKEWLRTEATALKWEVDEGNNILIAVDAKDFSYKIDWEQAFLLQSTEMFDKNGVLIFQGHILKNNEGKCFEVFYALGSFFIADGVEGDRVFLDDNLLMSMEVVGTIFENSELIQAPINEEEFNNKITQNNESTEN